MTSHPTLRVPLVLVEFERLLSAGHGRAALDLRVHGLRDRGDALRRACVRNVAYDPQVESGRGPWMLGLLDSVGGPGPWMDDILRALPATENHHDAQQLAEMLELLAQRGDERARAVLAEERRRARFQDPGDDDETDWTLGPWPPDHDPKSFVGPPEAKVDPVVPAVAEVERWLDALAKAASPADVYHLFPRQFHELDEVPFVARALELLEHPKPWVRAKTGRLVERMRHPRMREEGFCRLRDVGFRAPVATLLMRNLADGDSESLASLLPSVDDIDAVHDACFVLAALSRRHRREESWRRLCTWSYERSPCQNCRSDAVGRLHELGVEPWLRAEWRHDSDSSTRTLGALANPTDEDGERAAT